MEKGTPIPVVITVYADRSFSFEMRTPPVSYFIKKAAKLEGGSKTPGRDMAGAVTKAQVKEIAEKKMKDLNCDSIDAAMRLVEGSARSMGIEVREYATWHTLGNARRPCGKASTGPSSIRWNRR
jgi:large subunit ribosomal protein L11